MIREIKDKAAIAAALELIWVTFLQFEAPDYSDEGIQAFRSFIDDEDIIASLEFWGDYAGDELRGTIAATSAVFSSRPVITDRGSEERCGSIS